MNRLFFTSGGIFCSSFPFHTSVPAHSPYPAQSILFYVLCFPDICSGYWRHASLLPYIVFFPCCLFRTVSPKNTGILPRCRRNTWQLCCKTDKGFPPTRDCPTGVAQSLQEMIDWVRCQGRSYFLTKISTFPFTRLGQPHLSKIIDSYKAGSEYRQIQT